MSSEAFLRAVDRLEERLAASSTEAGTIISRSPEELRETMLLWLNGLVDDAPAVLEGLASAAMEGVIAVRHGAATPAYQAVTGQCTAFVLGYFTAQEMGRAGG